MRPLHVLCALAMAARVAGISCGDPALLYSEDMEGTVTLVQSGVLSNWQYLSRPDLSKYAWTDNPGGTSLDPASPTDKKLTTPVISLSNVIGAGDAELKVDLSYDTEAPEPDGTCWDALAIEIVDADTGAKSRVKDSHRTSGPALTALNTYTTYGQNYVYDDWRPGGNSDKIAICGLSLAYVPLRIDLTSWKGKNIQVVFRFATDKNTAGEYMSIDDIVVEQCFSDVCSPVVPVNPGVVVESCPYGTPTDGTICAFECAIGYYKTGGNRESLCITHPPAQYDIPTLTCAEALCAPLTTSATGVEVDTCPTGQHSTGDLCYFKCRSGYRAQSGSTAGACIPAGTTAAYARPTLTCQEITCLPSTAAGANFPEAAVSSSATGTCILGYHQSGALPQRPCSAAGNWGSPVGSCEIDDCGALAVPANAVRTLNEGTLYGDLNTFACEPAHTMITGDSTRTCLAGAVWSGAPPDCVYSGLLDSLTVSTSYTQSSTGGGFPDHYKIIAGNVDFSITTFDDVGAPRDFALDVITFAVFTISLDGVLPSNQTMLDVMAPSPVLSERAVYVGTPGRIFACTPEIRLPGAYVFVLYGNEAADLMWHALSVVSPGPTDPTKTTLTGEGVGVPTLAGTSVSVVVHARDRLGNTQTTGGDVGWVISITSESMSLNLTNVTDNLDGSYTSMYTLTAAGVYDIAVSLGGVRSATKYVQRVIGLDTSDLAQTLVTGHESCVASSFGCNFTVRTRDVFDNPRTDYHGDSVEFTWQARGMTVLSGNVAKVGTVEAVYELSYPATVAGANVELVITLNGVPLVSSPFTAEIYPGTADPATTYGYGPGLEISLPEQNRTICIRVLDQFGNNVTDVPPTTTRLKKVGDWTELESYADEDGFTPCATYVGFTKPGSMIVEMYLDGVGISNSPETVDVVGSCTPGTYAVTQAGPCEFCVQGTYSRGGSTKQCSPCPPFSATNGVAIAIENCTCVAGYYAQGDGFQCTECPVGGQCRGGRVPPFARPGFFPEADGTFTRCAWDDACLGGEAFQCNTGYEGYMCGDCSRGYYTFNKKCLECGGGTEILLFFLFVLAFIGVGCLLYFNMQDRTAENRYTTAVIAFNSIQISAMFPALIDWPTYTNELLKIFSLAMFNIELASPECSMPAANFFILKYYFYMFLPVVLALMFAVWAVILAIRKKILDKKGEGIRASKPHLFAPATVNSMSARARASLCNQCLSAEHDFRGIRHSCLRAFYQLMVFVYLPLASNALKYLSCKKNDAGISVLVASPATECYTAGWYKHLPTAIIMVILYCVGIPAFIFGILTYKRRGMDPIKFELRYGFLASRYDSDFYFWEVTTMMRKFSIVLCVVFGGRDSGRIQLGFACVALMFFVMLHQRLLPFRSPIHNNLEYISMMAAFFTLFFGGLFYDSVGTFRAFIDAVIVIIILGNLLVLVRFFFLDMRDLYRQQSEAFADACTVDFEAKACASGLNSMVLENNTGGTELPPLQGGSMAQSHVVDSFVSDGTVMDNDAGLRRLSQDDSFEGHGSSDGLASHDGRHSANIDTFNSAHQSPVNSYDASAMTVEPPPPIHSSLDDSQK